MRLVVATAEVHLGERANRDQVQTQHASHAIDDSQTGKPSDLRWSLDDCIELAQETRDAYAPVAGHLRMHRLEADLHELAFAVLLPDDYRRLRTAHQAATTGALDYLESVCDMLRNDLAGNNLDVEVQFRVKSLYSAYQKLKAKGLDYPHVGALYDLLGVRVITTSVEDCYKALGRVHEVWRPVEGRFKDYIVAPKPGGYQSLHTTVYCLQDRVVEVQMRTQQMHEVAEYSMHYGHKNHRNDQTTTVAENKANAQAVLAGLGGIRGLRESDLDGTTAGEIGEAPSIRVYTRDGQLKLLPIGSTPLEFAYHVHTDIGNHATSARISVAGGRKRLVSLDYQLRDGETVEIISSDESHPTYEWLSLVCTRKVREKILRYLRAHGREADLEHLGRERMEDELRAMGIRAPLAELEPADLEWLAQQLRQSSVTALLVALGGDRIDIASLRALMRARFAEQPTAPAATAPRPVEGSASLRGLQGILTQPALCCHPLPGDALIGYVSRGSGLVIHRFDCPNVPHLRIRAPERVIAVEWPSDETSRALQVHLVVHGTSPAELLRDVETVVSRHQLSPGTVRLAERTDGHAAIANVVLEISQLPQLTSLLRDLRATPGITFAERDLPRGSRRAARG
jgi:GTP pyrophosphokinase